jgi:peptidoglycan/LPS O-acetylase OafA/YrhL
MAVAVVRPISPEQSTPALQRLYDNLGQKKIQSLDGLRAVAVLLVICNHIGVPFAPRGRGVLTFFVLSGFLITWLLLKEAGRTGTVSVKDFYIRRVLRIFPAFYVFGILSYLLTRLTVGPLPASARADYISAFFYAGNYWHAISHANHHYLGHIWALCIEEQFYLLWPLLFAAFYRDLRKLTYVLVGLIVFVDIYRMVLFFGFHVPDRWLNFTFDSRADHLLVGCLLAVLLRRGALASFWNFVAARLWVSMVVFALILASIALGFRYGFAYKYGAGFILDPLLTAVFLVQVMVMGDSWLWGWLNWGITRYMGRISYSMFLYHLLAIQVTAYLLPQRSLLRTTPVAVLLTVLMGTCSYYLIELRFLRLKSKFIVRPEIARPEIARPERPALQVVPAAPRLWRLSRRKALG